MRILVVDDVEDNRLLLEALLQEAGYDDVRLADSAAEAFSTLTDFVGSRPEIDLILLDIRMPGIDGIEACRTIKASPELRDIPIIMVTAQCDTAVLDDAFAAGAFDYVTKPFEALELLARVRCALDLKREMDERKARERELVETALRLAQANAALERLSTHDALTDIANRRRFDEVLETEWRRMLRDGGWLSVLIVDVDHFKQFNDAFGHQAGDECLRRIGDVLRDAASRPGDLAARYGGEEFVVILAQTEPEGAHVVAEEVRAAVERLGIRAPMSPTGTVTVSAGVASIVPTEESTPALLVGAADFALYRAKQDGRNRVACAPASMLDRARSTEM